MAAALIDSGELKAWLAERLGTSVADNDRLFSNGLLDSFDLVDIVSFIEKQSGKRIRAIDVNTKNFDTVAMIAAFLNR